MAHTNVIADVAPPSTAGGTPSGGLGWPHQVVGLTSNPPAKRKRRETAWWRKKSEANASILIIIHVGSLGNVQSTCHISVTCIHGYIYGHVVNNLKTLWILKCNFRVFGPKK
jgi:hypothetical protein